MKPKILFIVPPTKAQNGTIKPYSFPHMGIGYLMSYLKERNIDVKVIDTSLNYSDKEKLLISSMNEYKPDLIGLSLFSTVSKEGEEIVKIIKENFSIPVVVGGPHISCTKEDFLKKTGVEYGITKEGERPLYNLIKNLFITNKGNKRKQIKALYKTKGLIFRDNKGKFIFSENDDLIADLDSIPYPDYLSFGIENYTDYHGKNFIMITSRGCPYQCSYCAAPVCTGRRFRMRSAENVIGEIEFWLKYGFKNFGIFDDSFNQNMERAKEICRELLRRKLGITFDLYNGLRANMVDKELFRLLKKAGCTFIGFGMESGNEEMLKSIGKSLKKEEIVRAVNLANEVGIRSAVNFILGHPGETYQTAMDTLNFAQELKCSYVNIYNLVPIPGTRAHEILKKTATFFYSEDYYLNNIVSQSVEPIFETPELTKKEREKLYKMGRNICKKTIFQFRLGKELGWLVYVLLHNDKVFKFANYLRETGWLGRFYNKIRR